MSSAAKSNETVTIVDNTTGKKADFPLLSGSIGPKVIDVRKLYDQLGHFTYDPGYMATGSCDSAITYIDGDEGILLHRGMELCFMLLNGHLPGKAEKDEFTHSITYHTMVHEQIMQLFRAFRRDAHPMAVLAGVVSSMAAFYHDSTDIHDPKQREIASHRLIAKMPTIAAMCYKYSVGQPFVYPRNDLKYSENFLFVQRELHAHDVQRAGRGIQDQPGAGEGARPHPDPARRP